MLDTQFFAIAGSALVSVSSAIGVAIFASTGGRLPLIRVLAFAMLLKIFSPASVAGKYIKKAADTDLTHRAVSSTLPKQRGRSRAEDDPPGDPSLRSLPMNETG